MKIFLVGGAVRDQLLGLEVKERDWVVVGGTEKQMLAQNFQKVGKDFPVYLHPETHEEYALARIEKKTSRGYYGFECDSSKDVTLEEDLMRRDLTINAMARDKNNKIIDPFGGQEDLKNKILRHVSPAFIEDPLRVLRVARFAARFANLGFKVAEETMELIQKIVSSGELDTLTPERVWKETYRALMEPKPTAFIEVLRACGALAKIFPALNKLWGVPQTAKYHPEVDTGVHVMMTLDMASILTNDPKIRFAVLCHDLGKGQITQNQLPSHKGHEELSVPLIKKWCAQYRVPNDYRDLAVQVARWHMHAHKAFELKSATLVKMLKSMDALRNTARFEAFLIAAEADARGRKGKQDEPYPQADFLRQVLQVVQAVSAQPFIDQGFSGKQLGPLIYQEQVRRVKEFVGGFDI